MRCEDVESKLLELIEGELPPGQHAEILSHVDGCATCATEFTAYRNVLACVEIDPVPEPSPGFWEEFLPSLKHRIGQETHERKPMPAAWLTGAGWWFALRPRFIASLAVAAVSIFVVVRLPGVLPIGVNRQTPPVSTEQVVGQYGERYNETITPRPDRWHQQSGEPLVVAGEVIEEPSILMAAIQRIGGLDKIVDRLEAAWILRQEADPADSLASLDEKERQLLVDHLNQLKWLES
ncbi:hypothetical protein MELA_02130 [Candidatus Methylomirabilis lanthanidiphila]|uniref:Putative zinc-finger domain-containing protein n=1 Tax=Candidatus Methylomirabilis lanthanidiphila TaxID=2211376 RepID=A0A564ZK91_9BACT|nr:zf-HC2 domain-containing protein [Candidatus Methylomirabilis lanthanidiphila]VUZ85745.1 hypothetical protein MELA_02130 [Candidatus Methylomirabilis lanthanidiphila]